MDLTRTCIMATLLSAGAAQAATLPPPPVARNDSYLLDSLTLQIAAPGLLANDSGTNPVVSGYFGPSDGTLDRITTDGSFRYTPSRGFAGVATFDYVIVDAFNRTARATVSIDASQSVPVARNDYFTANATSFSIGAPGLLANDSGGIGNVVVASYAGPSSGTIDWALTDGSFKYTPRRGFAGVASFSYTSMDELGRTSSATAYIDYAASIPVAFADSFSVQAGGLLEVGGPGLLANDFGGIGTVMLSGYRNPAFGTVQNIFIDGGFRYRAPAGFTGIDTFTYTTIDALGRTGSGTVSINVTPVPEAGTWLMMAAGLPLLAAVARRRRRG